MLAGFCALVGGAIAGASLAFYFASRLLFSTEQDWTAVTRRQFRTAMHCSCAGGTVLALSGIADQGTILPVLSVGLLGSIAGTVGFIYAAVKNLRPPEIEQNEFFSPEFFPGR